MTDPGMRASSPPALSVVLATTSEPPARRSLAAYAAQTAAARVEVVLVAPASELERFDAGATPRLHGLRRVAAPEPFTVASARAAGALAAAAPWVFVGETHSFADPPMCGELLAAIGAAGAEPPEVWVTSIYNVNPTTAVSWASFLIDYGAWAPGQPDAETTRPPIYNALFARTLLGQLGERLPAAFSPYDESVFPHSAADGRAARRVPRATIGHLNIDRIGIFCRSKTWAGMAVGAQRARRWGWSRRVVYAGAAPLIAAVLFARTLRSYGTSRRRGDAPAATVPLLALGAAVRAWGEALGYLGWAPHDLDSRIEHLEIHKREYVVDWND